MATPGTNLGAELTSFVGRDDARARLASLLDEGRRLVTLVGPPGTGKTRLARRFGLDALARFAPPGAGGVWLVDCAPARDFEDVAAALARVAGISLTRDESAGEPTAQIARMLDARGPTLLILDDFEHLARAHGARVSGLLDHAPRLAILVTSRERLAVAAEQILELEPLGVEIDGDPLASPAARLFVERARAVRPDYAPEGDPAEAARVAELVRTLDGLPLPIELAAARMGVLGTAKLLERLRARRLDVLGRAPRDASPRHASLRAAIEHSWELLEPDTREALERCAIFAGAFDLEAAEAILDAPEALDRLQRLRETSLLAITPGLGGDVGYALLHSVRAFARERLAERGALAAVEARHGAHHAARADALVGRVRRYGEVEAERALEALADELRAAFERGDPASAVPCALGLDVVLARRGPVSLHRDVLARARAAASAPDRPLVDAAIGALELRVGRARAALDALEALDPGDPLALDARVRASIEVGPIHRPARGGDDRWTRARTDLARARAALALGEVAEAEALAREAADALERLGDRAGTALASQLLARALVDAGRAAEADVTASGDAGGRPEAIVEGFEARGSVESARGRDRSYPHLAAALGVARDLGDGPGEVRALVALAIHRLDAGDLAHAARDLEDAERLGRGLDLPDTLATVLFVRALARLHEASEAHELLEEAARLAVRPDLGALIDAARGAARRRPPRAPVAAAACELLAALAAPSHDVLTHARPLAEGSALVRIAARLLERALPELERRRSLADARDPERAALVVGPEGKWFRVPGGEVVELDRKHKPAALLDALARATEPIGREALVALVWPDEKILEEAAKDRLYATVALLRKAGIGNLVESAPTGYRLDPSVRVVRADG